MGKYIRNANGSGEVAVVEVAASSPLGVRTRSRAHAMQGMQKQQQAAEGAGADYLELRSRKLRKLPPVAPAARRCSGRKAAAEEKAEAFFGENVLELGAAARSDREVTPPSLIRDPEAIRTPGSSTRPGHSDAHRRVQTPVLITPSSLEMDEFFGHVERQQQQSFTDKYNFDPVNNCPLPGRYEWVKLH